MQQITENRKAYHNYFISDETEAGIILEGSEVKGIRSGHMSISESFVTIKNGECFLHNAYIRPYEKTASFKPEPLRTRKLLLHKSEILRLQKKLEAKGFTIVPLKVYINKKNIVKIKIGLGKGKKLYDKRETLKQKTIQRDLQRYTKF